MTEEVTGRSADTVSVVNSFRRILRALRVASGATQTMVGISAAQLFVLSQLANEDVLSVNDLAARTLTDRSSVAAVVERLVERGLVSRARSAEDRRRAAIHITPAGRALLKAAPPAPTQRLIDGLAQMDDAELQTLSQLLTHLVHTMDLDATPATMLFEGDAPSEANGAQSEAVANRG